MNERSPLDLPPAYRLETLRELGNAFDHACDIAPDRGAGALVWTRRFDLAECAVVLEPEEPFEAAVDAFFCAANALAGAISALAPPERAVTFGWPDSIMVDGVTVGGVRLGWPVNVHLDEPPAWLVAAIMVRTTLVAPSEEGFRPLLGALDETGFVDISPATIVESFSRYLMRELDLFQHAGADQARTRYQNRLAADPDSRELLSGSALAAILMEPSWFDREAGMPRC